MKLKLLKSTVVEKTLDNKRFVEENIKLKKKLDLKTNFSERVNQLEQKLEKYQKQIRFLHLENQKLADDLKTNEIDARKAKSDAAFFLKRLY